MRFSKIKNKTNKKNGPVLTLKRAKIGPVLNFTAYIYAVKLKTGPRFGVYKLKTGPSYKLKTGPSFFCCFSPILKCFGGFFCNTNSVTVCQNSVFAKFWVIKNEVFEKKIAFLFFLFYVGK